MLLHITQEHIKKATDTYRECQKSGLFDSFNDIPFDPLRYAYEDTLKSVVGNNFNINLNIYKTSVNDGENQRSEFKSIHISINSSTFPYYPQISFRYKLPDDYLYYTHSPNEMEDKMLDDLGYVADSNGGYFINIKDDIFEKLNFMFKLLITI